MKNNYKKIWVWYITEWEYGEGFIFYIPKSKYHPCITVEYSYGDKEMFYSIYRTPKEHCETQIEDIIYKRKFIKVPKVYIESTIENIIENENGRVWASSIMQDAPSALNYIDLNIVKALFETEK